MSKFKLKSYQRLMLYRFVPTATGMLDHQRYLRQLGAQLVPEATLSPASISRIAMQKSKSRRLEVSRVEVKSGEITDILQGG
jgi:hypothetical protein